VSINPITIVFMGDSITEGQYVHHSLRWSERVTKRVKSAVESRIDIDQLHFFNRGISGETTRQGLERFPRDVQVLEPSIITLQFGLNDCNCWDTDKGLPRVSEGAYKENLLEMIARAQKFGAKHIILSTNHPTLRNQVLASGQTLEERRVIYNEIVREVASISGVRLCDIEQAFSDIGINTLNEYLLPEPDILHLSELGHEKYANAIIDHLIDSINDVLREKSDD